MAKISEKIKIVQDNINAACSKIGRDPREVNLVVVTKSASLEQIKEVIKFGILEFGENRVQQLKKVAVQVSDFLQKSNGNSEREKQVRWHMIGHLQRNKVNQVLPIASLIHSVDTLRLAEEVNAAGLKLKMSPKVLLQVNTSQEPQKYGVPVGAAVHLAEQIQTLSNIELAGIMTMAPLTRNKDVIRSCFSRAKEIFDEIKGESVAGTGFKELSMGMSSDYEIAVEEGATILRIGSSIFT